MTTARSQTWLAIFFIVMGAILRVTRHVGWLPLPPNFAPVSAMGLFSASRLPRKYGVLVPLGLMLLSDAVIGFDRWTITLAVYLSFLASAGLGFWLRRRVSFGRWIFATLAGSVIFFLVTNAAVWMFGKIYPSSIIGLWQSYIAGLPFFRNTLAGDLVYSSMFFGLHHLVVVYFRQRALARDLPPHG
ncbi:MAG: hypothetical protein HY092_02575 [Candidatus Kerfeldbacteria bacterium]|nr:hypothetical protein [Candidatus Kerfeldbacteria bacterium]